MPNYEDLCVNYFAKITQSDVPVRQINKYAFTSNPPPLNDGTQPIDPCNTWYCNNQATEYDCMGITYTPIIDTTGATGQVGAIIGYVSSYKTLQEWSATWQDGTCQSLFQDMITGSGTSQSTVAFSPTNFQVVQDDFKFMFSRYFNHDKTTAYSGLTGTDGKFVGCGGTGQATNQYQNGGRFSNIDNNCNVYINGTYGVVPPGQPSYDGFLDTLLNTCQAIPGACQLGQQFMCQNCDRQQIIYNPYLTKLCGCINAADTSTSNAFYNDSMQNYSPACDPICNRVDTIKSANPTNGTALSCNANVCVMDAVSINSISSTGVVPTFNQVCPACADGNGNCICIIDATFDSTIPSVKGADGLSLSTQARFNQYCPNSQCFIADPQTGIFQEVACLDTLPKNEAGDARVKIPTWVILALIILLIFFILAIFAYKYQTENIPVYLVSTKFKNY